MSEYLTDNMKTILTTIAETAHGKYNGAVVRGLMNRGLLTQPAYKGLVLTERGYFWWLFLQGEIDETLRDELLKGALDD